MTEEIYPMPFFVNLIVSDLEASSQFYQETLGFRHIFTMPGPGGKPALVHLPTGRAFSKSTWHS
jgi:catechol 2,3-dioxygenase-like lactoylglutathione lyase family enzyme